MKIIAVILLIVGLGLSAVGGYGVFLPALCLTRLLLLPPYS